MLDFLKGKTRVIVDTNFLFIPGELGLDIFSEINRIVNEPHEICVVDKTFEELEGIIAKSSSKESFNAKLGFIMAKQKSLKTLSSSKGLYADKAILEAARNDPARTIVATQDAGLRKELKRLSVRIITLRQKKYLELG